MTDLELFRSLVEQSGLSHRRIASQLGASERTMRYWLSGKRRIPSGVIADLRGHIQGQLGRKVN